MPGVPQCQRSPNRTILGPSHKVADDTWRCPGAPYSPGCPGGELYERTRDGLAHELLVKAIAFAETQLGRPAPLPVDCYLGESPLTVYERGGERIHVYLSRDVIPQGWAYEAGHEAVHVVARSGPTMRHWTHEMVAMLMALRFLDSVGMASTASRTRARLRTEAEQITAADVIAEEKCTYPDGLYGRVYLIGQALVDAVGWNALLGIVDAFNKHGRPDHTIWLLSLAEPARQRAMAALTQAPANGHSGAGQRPAPPRPQAQPHRLQGLARPPMTAP